MITKEEITRFARRFGLSEHVVEKDYALSWMLHGIANHARLQNAFIFKGGTCLKKCYFGEYRFSEDLDFTIRRFSLTDENLLKICFLEVSEWIEKHTGMRINAEQTKFKKHREDDGYASIQGSIYFTGPLQQKQKLQKIKLDLTTDEIIVLPLVKKKILHPYSDAPNFYTTTVCCYSFEEVFAEKLRALFQRFRPRDLYDVIHLYQSQKSLDPNAFKEAITKKFKFRNLQLPELTNLKSHVKQRFLEEDWIPMLGHQIGNGLQPPTFFLDQLPNLFAWLDKIN